MLLLEGCTEILARPLTTEERDLVQGWATKKRGSEYPAVDDILAAVAAEMARETPDGRAPYGLKWAANGVSTVFRVRSAVAQRPVPARSQQRPRHEIPPEDMAAYEAWGRKGLQ